MSRPTIGSPVSPRDRTRLSCPDCIALERFVVLCEAHALQPESQEVEGSVRLVGYLVLGVGVMGMLGVGLLVWWVW